MTLPTAPRGIRLGRRFALITQGPRFLKRGCFDICVDSRPLLVMVEREIPKAAHGHHVRKVEPLLHAAVYPAYMTPPGRYDHPACLDTATGRQEA